MWANFHTHSSYCDGKDKPSQYVKRALTQDVKSLGFSSHAPLPFECAWCMKQDQLEEYLTDLGQLQTNIRGIEIYKGLEIDYIPGVISPSAFRRKLDYTIGSIHFVEKLNDGRHWEIDGPHNFFLEGLENIFNNDIQLVIERYFELTREMVLTDCPAIVGHLDKIKIQNINDKFFSESDGWYVDEITKTLKSIEDSGAIVEVNTRGIYQKKSTNTYPSPWVLKIIHEKNIPITLSTDAHHPDDLTNHFSETAKMLNQIGFQKIAVLKEGEWKQYKFNEHGIIFS